MTKEQIQEFTLKTSQANHSGLILILADMDKIYMEDAISSYKQGDTDGYSRNLELARRTHNELMSAINPADSMGRRVLQTLRYAYGCMNMSMIKKRPEKLEDCLGIMDSLQAVFEQLHSLDHEEPVMKNTHKVYAGLTYGKGILKESFGDGDYSNRGFTV